MTRDSRRPSAARPAAGGKRPGNVAKRVASTLSRESVVAAALLEIDRNGLENFSLRNLAKTLGVYPTAIAWHVSSRGQLLAEVAAVALADVLPPGFPDSWQSYLRQLFHRFREAIRRHPNVAPLIGTQLVANRGVDLEFVERLLAALAHAGFSGQRLVTAYNAVIAALVGFTTQEFAPIPADDTKAWQTGVRERLNSVQAFTHPILTKNMKLLANHAFILRWQNGVENPLDDSYDAFVEIVIAGLEQSAARRR
jgi:TetR/AcrR family tetracycline transcriptional repressor